MPFSVMKLIYVLRLGCTNFSTSEIRCCIDNIYECECEFKI